MLTTTVSPRPTMVRSHAQPETQGTMASHCPHSLDFFFFLVCSLMSSVVPRNPLEFEKKKKKLD